MGRRNAMIWIRGIAILAGVILGSYLVVALMAGIIFLAFQYVLQGLEIVGAMIMTLISPVMFGRDH